MSCQPADILRISRTPAIFELLPRSRLVLRLIGRPFSPTTAAAPAHPTRTEPSSGDQVEPSGPVGRLSAVAKVARQVLRASVF